MKSALILLTFFVLLSFGTLYAQEQDSTANEEGKVEDFFDEFIYKLFKQQQDSNYIYNYSEEVSLRLIGVGKYNYLRVRDRSQKTMLNYRPDPRINLGVGITYRWFSLDFAFNLGISASPEEFTSENVFDFSASLFTNKHYAEVNYKYYLGQFVSNSKNLSQPLSDSSRFRDDLRNSNFSLEYLYALNYRKFSLKAPFANNEIQRRSAGSIIAGASFNLNSIEGDRSIIPLEVTNDFNPSLGYNSLFTMSLALNIGYMYTIVVKESFYITLGLIPGFSLVAGDRTINNIQFIPLKPAFRIKSMNAIGYSKRRFYVGLSTNLNAFLFQIDDKAWTHIGNGKGKFFIGYRIRSK